MSIKSFLRLLGGSTARQERDLDAEIRAHMEMAVEERVARGESREDAERAVRREFGNEARVKEVTRTQWRGVLGGWWDRLGQDLRFGVRSLRRDPAFSLAAVLILVVGIGASSVVFTLADGVFFESPPGIEEADEIVGLRGYWGEGRESFWSYPDYEFVRRENDVFDEVLAYSGFAGAAAVSAGPGSPSPADVWVVSHSFFDALGTEMALGRGFLPEEGVTPRTHPVVVLHHDYWQSELGGDPEILSRSLSVNGTPLSVVGVAPPGFGGVSPVEVPPDLYLPIMMQGVVVPGGEGMLERRVGESHVFYKVAARLDEGVSLEAARANVRSLNAAWSGEFGTWARSSNEPEFRMEVSADAGYSPGEAERLRRTLVFLGIVAASVLLIGCANLAILLLARSSTRQGEMGVRSALGAGRGRLFRQLLTESALLAAAGGVAGLVLAYWGAGLVARLLPFHFAVDPAPDGSVVLVIGAATLAVTGLFGLVPAFRLARTDIAPILRREKGSTRRSAGRGALVVGQVAAAVVLVAGAGLFVRSVQAARSVNLGFEPENRLLMSVQLGNHGYEDEAVQPFSRQVLERIRALPGVASATVTAWAPFGGRWTSRLRPVDTEYEDEGITLYMNRAGTDYFESMGVEILAGRPFGAVDDAKGARSMVISRATAVRLWPDREAVGRTIRWRDDEWTVVGVAEDARYYTIAEIAPSQIYVPQGQVADGIADGSLTFLARTAVPPRSMAISMEAAIHEVDPGVAVFGIQTLADLVDEQAASYEALAILVSLFGLVALFMAAVGLYGVQAYLVGQRSREIGIRMALGAKAREVASGILGRGSALAVLGVVLGTALALVLGGWVREMLFGVEPQDPVTLTVVAGILLTVSMAASYVPARRASRVDPMSVLREE